MEGITWPEEFLEFLKCCRRHGARTLVFGGFAVSLHARPRTTGDLDLWCGLDPANWAAVKRALVDFGFDPVTVATLDFSECWSKRCTIETDGIPVDFIDRDSLVLSKIAAGRPQDLADLEQLRRTMRP